MAAGSNDCYKSGLLPENSTDMPVLSLKERLAAKGKILFGQRDRNHQTAFSKDCSDANRAAALTSHCNGSKGITNVVSRYVNNEQIVDFPEAPTSSIIDNPIDGTFADASSIWRSPFVAEIEAGASRFDAIKEASNNIGDIPSGCPAAAGTSSSLSDVNEVKLTSPAKKRIRRTPEEILAAKEDAKATLLARQEQRQRCKQKKLEERIEKEKETELKKAQQEKLRAMKPGECLKHMTILLHSDLPDVSPIYDSLMSIGTSEDRNNCLRIEISQALPIPKSIMWNRSVMDFKQGSEHNLIELRSTRPERDILVMMELEAFLTSVAPHRCDPSASVQPLPRIVQDLQKGCGSGCRLTLVVMGLDIYQRHLKTLKARAHRSAVLGKSAAGQAKNKKRKQAGPKELRNIDIIVEKSELDVCLAELQIETSVAVCFVKDVADLSQLIWRMTKAVAEAPYKAMRQEVFSEIGFTSIKPTGSIGFGGSSDIREDGRGSLDVWMRQLMQIPAVSAEIARTIINAYGSPNVILNAYDACASEDERKRLIASLQIRRGAGLNATSRRIGPKVSEKVCVAFNCMDPDRLLI